MPPPSYRLRAASFVIVAMVFCIVLFVPAATAQSGAKIDLDLEEVMNKEDQEAAGLTKLNASERAALERWIEEWTLTVAERVYEDATSGASNTGTASGGVYAGVGSGHWISRVVEGGAYIELEDGSLWEIASVDRVYTSIWLPISEITVLQAEEPIGEYRYVLINTDDGERVYAKLVKQ